jgi:hypothetical protein
MSKITPMREQAKQAQKIYDEDLDKLWNIIKKSSSERAEEIMSQLDEKTITALRTRNNPYKKPVFKGNKNKLLAFNVINLTEKYLQRFAMTSLIGFVYRMLDEYEPEESKKFPSENDATFGNVHVRMVKELKRNKPTKLYKARAEEIAKRITELRSGSADDDVQNELRGLAKESFVVRAKMYKYDMQLLKEDRKEVKDKIKMLSAEADNHDLSNKHADKEIALVQTAIKNKTSYDEEVEKYKSSHPGETITTVIRDGFAKKYRLTLEQAESRTVASYEQEISGMKHAIATNTESAAKKREEVNELQGSVDDFDVRIKSIEETFATLKREYSQTFRSANASALDAVVPDAYEPTDEDIDAINASVKLELGIERTREEHTEYLQDIIQGFLDQYFVYNPDTHVQCAYKPNYEDPLRTPLQMDEHRRITEEKHERALIPPDDTFFRWNRYVENNYEELRQATDDIYAEKSDFEFDIVPLEVFEGPNAEADAAAFDRKYADEVEADILRATFGSHNLMGSWAQNREKRDFYNEHTEIIKRIINENEESQKFGRKLNKQRAEQKKAENEKLSGPHASGFADYKKSNPTPLRDHGATEASEIPTQDIIPKDTGKLKKGEMEVGVTQIRPVKRRGGRRGYRGDGEQWKFHIPEEKMEPGQVKVGRPSAMHKKIMQEERVREDAQFQDAF